MPESPPPDQEIKTKAEEKDDEMGKGDLIVVGLLVGAIILIIAGHHLLKIKKHAKELKKTKITKKKRKKR